MPDFWQTETWTDAGGNVWKVEDMEPRHRRNVIAWIERNADRLELADSLAYLSSPWFPQGEMAAAEIADGMAEMSTEQWLEHLPLYQRLLELEHADV